MQYERRWLAVVALGLSLFLSALDATIVALALPPIAQHFQLSDSLASAVTLSYAIPLTVLILPAGDLVSRFRTLPTFLISVVGFGLGSLICGLAPNFALLVAGRFVQGCFGAVIGTQAIAVAAAVAERWVLTPVAKRITRWDPFFPLLNSADWLAIFWQIRLPAGSSTGDLQLARRAPGRSAIQCLSSDGRLAASSAFLVGTPGVFQQRNGRWCPLLPLTL
ncbi:MAG: MFS transporter [Chloroflexi bacterium]|nr:MAG: MFS transporter [Chloroflexota bacterium]